MTLRSIGSSGLHHGSLMRELSLLLRKLTRYALNLTMTEWSATKRIADDIEEGKEDEFKFDLDSAEGCTFGYELPARYSLLMR
jgi:hypothetical protein